MNLEEVEHDVASVSFDADPTQNATRDIERLNVTKDIENGEMLNLTKPSIQAENSIQDRTQDLPQREPPSSKSTGDMVVLGESNLTQNLDVSHTRDHEMNRTKDLPSEPIGNLVVPQDSTYFPLGETKANLTQNIDANFPKDLNLNRTKEIGIDCTKNLCMNRTKDLDMNHTEDHELNLTKDLEMNRTKALRVDHTKALEMICTKDVDMNCTKALEMIHTKDVNLDCTKSLDVSDLDVNLTNDLGIKGTTQHSSFLKATDNLGLMNLTQDIEENPGRVNLTQNFVLHSSSPSTHRAAMEDSIDFHHLPNLDSTRTLECSQSVPKKATASQDQTLSLGVTENSQEIYQSGCASLQDQEEECAAQATSDNTMLSQIIDQSELSSTRTLSTTERGTHTKPTPEGAGMDCLGSTQTLNTTVPEAHIKSGLGEARKDWRTYNSANILKETTNKVQNGAKQLQSRTLVRSRPDPLRGAGDKDPVKLKHFRSTSGLGRLQQSDQEEFKQPAMPKLGRVGNNMVRQKSLSFLNRPNNVNSSNQRSTKPSSELAIKTGPEIEKAKSLRRQTSAGSGVKVLAPSQLLPPVQPRRVISPTVQSEVSAPSSRLCPPSRIPSTAGSKLRLPGFGGSLSRLPVLGQKP